MGAKKKPFYRLVVADARSPRDGRFIEAVGLYDPLANPALVKIDAERVKDWISKGARPTDVARQLLVSQGLLERTGRVYEKGDGKPRASKKAQAKAAAAAEAPPEAPPEPDRIEPVVAESTPVAEESAAVVEASATETPAAEAAAEAVTEEDLPAQTAPVDARPDKVADAPVEGSPEAGGSKQ